MGILGSTAHDGPMGLQQRRLVASGNGVGGLRESALGREELRSTVVVDGEVGRGSTGRAGYGGVVISVDVGVEVRVKSWW